MSTPNEYSLATYLFETESRNTELNFEQTWKHGGDDKRWPHPPSLRLGLSAPSHWDATTPSPCGTPHFRTQERLMFSNPTLSEPRLSPAVTMSDDMLSTLTLPLHCASILQAATPPWVVAFESWTISAPICFNRFTLAESWIPNRWTSAFVFTLSRSAFAFLKEMDFSYKYLFAICSCFCTSFSAAPLRIASLTPLLNVEWSS